MTNQHTVCLIYPNLRDDLVINTGDIHEGLASLAAVLEEEGARVILHQYVDKRTFDDLINEVVKAKPLFVGLTTTTMSLDTTRCICGALLSRLGDTSIIVGGIHPTLDPEGTLALPEINVVCVGEGERPIAEMYRKLVQEDTIHDIPGIWIEHNGEITANPPGPLVEDLDSLPLPAFHLFRFHEMFYPVNGMVVARMSRGCPFACTYCANHILKSVYPNKNKYFRFLTPDRAIEKIQFQLTFYQHVETVSFSDDLMVTPGPWLPNFLERYVEEVGLPYIIRARLDLFNDELAALLKKTGCIRIVFGLESGNEEIRHTLLNRKMKEPVMLETSEICHRHDLDFRLLNMIGLPNETPENILETIEQNARMRSTDSKVSVFYPYYGNQLYDMCVKSGIFDPTKRLSNQKEDSLLVQEQLPESFLIFCRSYFQQLIDILAWLYAHGGEKRTAQFRRLLLSDLFPYALFNSLDASFVKPFKSFLEQRKFRLFKPDAAPVSTTGETQS